MWEGRVVLYPLFHGAPVRHSGEILAKFWWISGGIMTKKYETNMAKHVKKHAHAAIRCAHVLRVPNEAIRGGHASRHSPGEHHHCGAGPEGASMLVTSTPLRDDWATLIWLDQHTSTADFRGDSPWSPDWRRSVHRVVWQSFQRPTFQMFNWNKHITSCKHCCVCEFLKRRLLKWL